MLSKIYIYNHVIRMSFQEIVGKYTKISDAKSIMF